jgi:hypothetical protein
VRKKQQKYIKWLRVYKEGCESHDIKRYASALNMLYILKKFNLIEIVC